ncbi:MAG: gamma-glutamyl-phosphate reductase, partial [Myxococcota bacterium]
MSSAELETEILDLTRRAREASETLGEIDTRTKNAWLARAVERLEAARPEILDANARDLEGAREKNVPEPLVNRLSLSEARWNDMIRGLRDVAVLPDPVGGVDSERVLPNGLRVGRMRIPLGVIAIIYESR